MATKAGIYLKQPSASGTYTVGQYITIRLGVKNTGNETGWIQGYIIKDWSICVDKQGEFSPGGVLKLYGSECDINMPNKNVNVTFVARHWNGSAYVTDESKSITLTPTVAVCSQNVKVNDKDTGAGIANVTVAARPSVGSIIRCTTDSNGRCTLTNLIEGGSYRLVVEGIPSGYKCQYTVDCETTITACEGEKTFRLKKEVLICEQKIRVVDDNGNLIDASVSVSGATCSRISTGKYKITLSTGDSLRAKATKSGYIDATYNFTACRSEITLTLRKEVAPPEYCYQYVRVETSDSKSVTYEITWGVGTWAMGSTPDTSMLYCERGKSYTATATAEGYKSASKTFTACTSQFTLTLTKEVAPACDTYTTKSSCEAAGCFWYNNACHRFGPAVCSDYTDALTCVANNCYWWSDGTCHDTEEGVAPPPPPPEYELIASNNTHVTVKEPSGTLKIKELNVPANKQSGEYSVHLLFASPHLGSVMARLSDQDDKTIWIYVVSTNATAIKLFSHTNLKKLILERYESGNLSMTSRNFELYRKKTPIKKDTVICKFDVYDATGEKTTDLVAGVQYAIKAYLCKVEGGGCAEILKGCDSGCEISGETLKLFLFGAAEIAKGTTNVDGYTAFFWTPSADIAGDNSIRLEFKGSTKYNASETGWKTVTVAPTSKFVVDSSQVPAGGNWINCVRVKKIPFFDIWEIASGGISVNKPRAAKVEFSLADGLEFGDEYAVVARPEEFKIPLIPIPGVHVFKKEDVYTYTKGEITDIKLTKIYAPVHHNAICPFFGITPGTSQCTLFIAEFADPIYVANTLSVIAKHEDIAGNSREPETLDYIILPIVMVGSALPMVPAGKISQYAGRLLKLGKKSAASKLFLIKNHHKIHQLIAVGDETRILKFKGFFDLDNLDEALKVLDGGVVASEATVAAKALKRTSLRNWIRGIIAKWKKDNPITPIEKLMDDTAEHGGNVFKTQADVVVKHVDDAGGDWTKIRKIWDDTVKTADDVVYVDFHLAGKSDDVQVMHNIMRYTKDDFIKALKGEKAAVPEFANRFDEGVDFMLRHIGDETGTEVAKYRKAIKGLSDADINNIVKNLDAAGQVNLARIIKTCKVAPEGGMKFFDDAADALKGAKKFSAEERKALGGILDSGGDEAVKHLDAKWTNVFNKLFDTEDSINNPQGRRFWDYIRGHGKTKDMMAKYGKSRFRDLPFYAKAAVFMGVFYVVNSAWKTMQDFCFALFMGEETIQWGGFGGIVLNNLLYKFNEKPLQEKKEIIKTFEEFSEKRHTIHDLVTGGSSLFESLCLVFGKIFKGFWEADAVNMWALDTTIEYLKKGINPYTGIGECSIKVRANKDGVDFWYQGSPTKWHGGAAFSWTEIKQIPVRATPEEVTVCAWKPGYLMATHIIKIYPEDVGKTGYDAKEMELFELIPESAVSETPNPLGYQSPPDTTNLPTPIGNANPREYFGEVVYGSIRCESIPTGAGVYLDVKDTAHYKGKTDITLDHIPVGSQKIIQTFPNFNDCVVNVNVVVEPMVYARCRFPTPTCSFTPSITKPRLYEVVTFDASASTPGTGAASLTYDWDWGDLKTHGTKKIDTHAYTAKGVYAVKLTVTNELGGSKVCTTNITVEVATGNIKCYCETAEFCGRNADIFVDGNKVDVTKESGYTYIKDQTPGVHTVRYNLLDVMECSGSVTVTADKDVDFKCQLKSKLPASQTAKVTAIVDGDGIKTDKTGTHEIRIIGYDAFECRIYPSDCTLMGKYGYEKLKSIIPVGTSVTLKIDQWLPLGVYNRVIADVFVGTTDIAAEMLKSCLVRFPAKTYRDKYFWDPWDEYERIWCDPTKVIPPDEYKPKIVDIDLRIKTFKIKNNWLALWFLPEFVDSGGTVLGKATERKIEVGKTSSAITYFVGTYAIKLYARVDTKDDWTLVDTGYVAAVPPVTKTVIFKSVPTGASVTVTKVATAGALRRPLKRLAQSLKKVRSM